MNNSEMNVNGIQRKRFTTVVTELSAGCKAKINEEGIRKKGTTITMLVSYAFYCYAYKITNLLILKPIFSTTFVIGSLLPYEKVLLFRFSLY